jgi:hypothetical protein
MVGCPGTVTFDNKASLCPAGYRPASAQEWITFSAGAAPSHDYWTRDNLHYSGGPSACSVSFTGGNDCGDSTPMRVCTTAPGTDPEGNVCNWTDCGFGATNPDEYFGGCAGNTTAGTLCVPQGCANGVISQTFQNGMIGCAGASSFASAASLCGPGYRLATAAEWKTLRGGAVPAHDYWTADALRYSGTASSCSVSTFAGYSCPDTQPMRVCTPGGGDPEGNTCTWTNCGLGAVAPNDYFGGCVSDPTAGALCISARECADGTAEQVFDAELGIVGCAGAVAFADRDSLCAPGYKSASAADWVASPGVQAPLHDYWTNDDLKYSGSGPDNCFVSTTVGTECSSPMRLCTSGGTDAEGNACNWTRCGYGALPPPNYWFGGCAGNTTAGTICERIVH